MDSQSNKQGILSSAIVTEVRKETERQKELDIIRNKAVEEMVKCHGHENVSSTEINLYLFHGKDGNTYLGFGKDATEAGCLLEAEYPGCLNLKDTFPAQSGTLLKVSKKYGMYILDEVDVRKNDKRSMS